MISSVSVVGDDLSGVMAVGGELASRGLATILLKITEASHLESYSGSLERLDKSHRETSVVLTTESRYDALSAAREKVHTASAMLRSTGTSVLIKKVDSFLRGHIGPELSAAMQGFGVDKALCVVAAPSQGRTTVEGNQLIDGSPLGQKNAGSYLESEVQDANVVALLQQEFGDRVRHLGLNVVGQGSEAIRTVIRSVVEDESTRVVVCDATTVGQVNECVAVAIANGIRVLAGTTDIGYAVADALTVAGSMRSTLPVLVVSATASRAGRNQIDYLIREKIAELVEVPVAVLLKGTEASVLSEPAAVDSDVTNNITKHYEHRISELLLSGTNVLLCPETPSSNNREQEAASHKVAKKLAEIGAEALSATRVSGVVATGGETARRLLDSMEVRELIVGREVLPGIPEAIILDGPHAGLRFIAKTGAYGGPDSLKNLTNWLRTSNEAFESHLGVPDTRTESEASIDEHTPQHSATTSDENAQLYGNKVAQEGD